jgi:hypothetical protein
MHLGRRSVVAATVTVWLAVVCGWCPRRRGGGGQGYHRKGTALVQMGRLEEAVRTLFVYRPDMVDWDRPAFWVPSPE